MLARRASYRNHLAVVQLMALLLMLEPIEKSILAEDDIGGDVRREPRGAQAIPVL